MADALEADIRSINPRLAQGWMIGALTLATLVALIGLGTVGRSRDSGVPLTDLVTTIVPFALALALIAGVSARISTLELRGDHVLVRSWLTGLVGRSGRDLGTATAIRAELSGQTLTLVTPTTSVAISMRLWPPSARSDVSDELPMWGVEAPFGTHPSRHALRNARRDQRKHDC